MELPSGGGDWAIAVAIISAAVLWFFRTPKEVAEESSRRINDLEDAHHQLDKSVAGLVIEVRHLAINVGQLAEMLRRLDQERISGRHPTLG